ncbi:hypothetical protein GH714_025603 [Hevea brasiliensis]|uniref:Uncharacterized protein n=1 Tax=Hevea brasiliensis TaxID=3981 RepID=A0A6A6NBH2_HEVBR|nr:hypothetical protein GH714_025603 [Hevea brasiliensis]
MGGPKRGSQAKSGAQWACWACGPRGSSRRVDEARNEVHHAGVGACECWGERDRRTEMRFKRAQEDWARARRQTCGRGSNWRAGTPGARANEVHPPKILEVPGERERAHGQTKFKHGRELSARSTGRAQAASQPKTRFTRAGRRPKRGGDDNSNYAKNSKVPASAISLCRHLLLTVIQFMKVFFINKEEAKSLRIANLVVQLGTIL